MFSSLPALLAFCILLGLVHIMLAAALVTASRGMGWNMGSRDAAETPVPVHAGRAQRAARNFLETFPLFAAALVCAIAIHHDGHLAQLGATLYFWARVAYLPIYLLGIPGIRSVAWIASLVGLLLVVAALP